MDTLARSKRQEWLRRYLPAEVLATALAVAVAWIVYEQSGSFIAATAAGLVGEGIGFYGYFITIELITSGRRYAEYSFKKRIILAIRAASTNLLVEFLPAELLDTFLIRPFAMFIVPQHIHPYPLGFLIGKFTADIVFYAMAIVGLELRKRVMKQQP